MSSLRVLTHVCALMIASLLLLNIGVVSLVLHKCCLLRSSCPSVLFERGDVPNKNVLFVDL